MKHGHVTGDKVEKANSQTWYDGIQADHLARIEEGERHQEAQACARRVQREAEAQSAEGRQMMHPEALCSVNMHFQVMGYGTAQATGRGATPQEAVTNLTGTMAATIVALEDRAQKGPMNRYEKLGRLITCGLAKAASDQKLQERFMKAVQLVVHGHVSPEGGTVLGPVGGGGGDVYRVYSQTTEGASYYANATRCTCADRTRHEADQAYKCKHILAVLLYAKLGGVV